MRRQSLCLGTAFVFAAVCAPASAATPAELASSKAYAEAIYRAVPSLHFNFRNVRWTPELRNLIARDDAAAGGEVGALDADPICTCQDTWPGYRVMGSTVRVRGPDRATVTVLIHGNQANRSYSLDLVLTGGRWLVADVHTPDEPSFLAFMRRAVPDEERQARRR